MIDLQGPGDAQLFALSLFEAAPDAILVVRANGTIALANHMAERTFGYAREELIGLSVDQLVPLPQRHPHAERRAQFAQERAARFMGELDNLNALCKDGSLLPVEISLSPVDSSMGRLTVAIVRDVSRRRALESELRYASSHDALTGLYNRAFLDSVRSSLETDKNVVGVLIIDVDDLKRVNDAEGHAAGDSLIKRASQVLRAAAGPNDLAVRLGGDEFALLLPGANAALLDATQARLYAELARHNADHGGRCVEFSVGAALCDPGGSMASAMQLADHRMYDEKRRRRQSRERAGAGEGADNH
ncbi:MAG: diguanylate cyclase [Ahniella sp.]|nr:diguanylate cyclase [Ahniella sp.]